MFISGIDGAVFWELYWGVLRIYWHRGSHFWYPICVLFFSSYSIMKLLKIVEEKCCSSLSSNFNWTNRLIFFCLLRRDDLFEDWSGTWRTSTESSSSSVLQRNITQKYLMEWFYFIELIFFFDLFLLNIHLRPTIIKLRIFIGAFGIILILIARKIFQVILFYYWAARQSRSAR